MYLLVFPGYASFWVERLFLGRVRQFFRIHSIFHESLVPLLRYNSLHFTRASTVLKYSLCEFSCQVCSHSGFLHEYVRYLYVRYVHVQCRFYNTVVFYAESGTVACIFLRRLIQIICYWSGSACMNNYWPVGLSYTMCARCLHNDAHAALATGSCRLSKQSSPLKLQSVLTRSLT